MDIEYLPKFKRQYKKLSVSVQEEAENCEIIFRTNPFDTRLKTHKLKGRFDTYFAFSVNNKIRIIFDFVHAKKARFYQIGTHDIYR